MLVLVVPGFDCDSLLFIQFVMKPLFSGHHVIEEFMLYFGKMTLDEEAGRHLETLLSTVSFLRLVCRYLFLLLQR